MAIKHFPRHWPSERAIRLLDEIHDAGMAQAVRDLMREVAGISRDEHGRTNLLCKDGVVICLGPTLPGDVFDEKDAGDAGDQEDAESDEFWSENTAAEHCQAG